MFHAMEDNRLYNFNNGTQIDVALKSGKDQVDMDAFLNDISSWMEEHKNVIRNKYLPFSCLAVGLVPSQASAFLYGCFVGRAMEGQNLKITAQTSKIDKKLMAKKMKKNIRDQMGWLKKLLTQINHMDDEDDNEKV